MIVAGHIGYPWTEEMVALARKYPNVYIDTSAYTARRYPPELVRYLRADGRRKVLFGSNFPMIPPARALEHLDALELDDEARELFLEGNARRSSRSRFPRHGLSEGFAPFESLGPFLELVGPVLWRDDVDGPVFGLRVEDRHTNHRGTVQGGLLSTFVDFALGRAIEAESGDGKDRATVSVR